MTHTPYTSAAVGSNLAITAEIQAHLHDKRRGQALDRNTAASSLHVMLLAAGSSSRFGSPKQLADIAGRPMLARTLDTVLQLERRHPVTVVLGAGWPGVLLHEAVGHGLEGDFNRKGTSAFSGRIGQQVAARGVTIVDDGTLAARRGSLNVDDEGTPTQCTTLIEDGILRGYLQDKLNARLMGVKPTGNGRRQEGVAWLGLTAAGCAFTWHAHVHMSLLLVPPLYLVLAERPALRPLAEFVRKEPWIR